MDIRELLDGEGHKIVGRGSLENDYTRKIEVSEEVAESLKDNYTVVHDGEYYDVEVVGRKSLHSSVVVPKEIAEDEVECVEPNDPEVEYKGSIDPDGTELRTNDFYFGSYLGVTDDWD